VRPHLRPVLRTASTGVGLADEQRPLRRPAMPYLTEMVVIDQPDSMLYVRGDRSIGWGVETADVFAVARENLARRAPQPGGASPDGPVMLRFVEDGDAYWSSCLLVEGWLAGLAERVGGRPVAFVPDRDTLIVVADEPAVVEKLFDMIEADYLAASRPLSPVPYVSDTNGRTVPYDAPPGHPLHHPVRRAERVLSVQEYAQQRSVLGGRHAGADLAELLLTTRPDGSTFTATAWPRVGAALLPHADFVAFASAEDALFHVPWAEVVEHSPLRPVADLDPPRYRVDGWPMGAALNALRAAAVGP
jgi:hypothetical protein